MAVMSKSQFVQQYGRQPDLTPISTVKAPAAPRTFGEHITDLAHGVTNLIGAQGISDEFGASLAHATVPAAQKPYVDFPSFKTVAGSAIQTGANLIPGAGKGLGFLAKTAVGAGTGYAMDVGSALQGNREDVLTPGVGAVIGGALPAVGAVARPAARVVGRLLKGIGSGLSGASAKNLEAILENPQAAQKAQQLIDQSGGSKLLENNARTIVNGVSTVRQGARAEFGKAMQGLGQEDIDPQVFRQAVQPVLDKFGATSTDGKRFFGNVDFSEPRNLAKASSLVDELSKTSLDGNSLHNLMNKIDDAKYKVGSSDERLSFNAFLKDLHAGVKDAVAASTDKLTEANAKYSSDMELAEATEGIFGKVKYKNLPEVVRASKNLESLFSQKGLAPDVIDNFLTKLGVSPSEFKAGEAVRQIGNKESSANAPGLSLGEATRSVTSAAVTPEMVGKMTTSSGLTRDKLIPFLRALKTPARNLVIQVLLQDQQDNQR